MHPYAKGHGKDGLQIIKCVKLARMLKLLRLFRVRRLMEKYEHYFVHYLPYVDLFSLVSLLLFLGHIFGCFFYFFSTKDWWTPEERERMGDSDTWVYMQFGPDPSDHSVWERYVSAMVGALGDSSRVLISCIA